MSSSPTVPAAGQLALLAGSGPALAATAPEGLLEALAQVPDPRDRRGIRYRLVPVLAIAVCAMLAGARSNQRSPSGPLTRRRGCAPVVISILRLAGHASIADALRHAARDPARAFRLLTGQK